MFKKLVISVLICLILSACSSPKYRLFSNEGKYYITLSDDFISSVPADRAPMTPVYFQSLDELRWDFRNGTFTSDEFQVIALRPKDKNGRINTLNLDNLYDVTYPDIYQFENIAWYSTNYTFNFKSKQYGNGSISRIESDAYEKYAEWCESLHKIRGEILKKTVSEDGQTTEYIYQWINNGSTAGSGRTYNLKVVIEQFTDNGIAYNVRKHYNLDESTDVPNNVTMYCKDIFTYYYVEIKNLRSDITREQLAQFTIKEYEPKFYIPPYMIIAAVSVVIIGTAVTVFLILKKKKKLAKSKVEQQNNTEEEM